MRFVLNIYFGLPLFLCTLLACLVLFIALNRVQIYFPPAGAILLIPMILDEKLLFLFPVEVFAGAVILSCASLALFRNEK